MSEQPEVKTIREVETIVHGSGLWDGTGPVEFSNDGNTWSDAWAPTTEHPLPEFARVSVYRKDVRIPTTVTIRWDEQVPRNDEFWAGKWVGAPMRHFGRTARMVGFRQTFRELLGNVLLEDEDRADRADRTEPAPNAAPAVRDWAREIADASTPAELDAIDRDGRAARVFTPNAVGTALHRALKARRVELSNAWATPSIAVEIAVPDVAATVPDEIIMSVADAVEQARPAPQDYLPPANRAERRKAARRKGGKR